MKKIAEKQKTEKKEPIVLKNPTKSYHPWGKKTSLPTATATPISGGNSIFGKNISHKVLGIEESKSKQEEPEKSEKETGEKDENENSETKETEIKSSPEKTGEKVNFDKLSKTQFKMC